jgi:hypothetical protein
MDWIDLAQDMNRLVGFCEHVDEFLSFIKGGEFLDQLNNYKLLKKDCTSWRWLK